MKKDDESLTVAQITATIESIAPLCWQEKYDNSGLLLGSAEQKVKKTILCTDISLAIVEEAIEEKSQLIVSHHPPIFQGLKSINPDTVLGQMITLSIKNNIAWYAAHTNFDNAIDGVNSYWTKLLKMQDCKTLEPRPGTWGKLQVYVPLSHANALSEALISVGCGKYKQYDSCRWQTEGEGSFRPLEGSSPFVGSRPLKNQEGKLHTEKEIKIEMIYPTHASSKIEAAIKATHPYQQPAYDFLPLLNNFYETGAGICGKLPRTMSEKQLLENLKKWSGAACIRHSGFKGRDVETIAICGGSGAFLQGQAKALGAQVFITGELKYHDYVNADPALWLVELGHFESEQFTKHLIYDRITKIFPNFAVLISKKDSCPIFYF